MTVRVLRRFTGLGRDLRPGEVLEASEWPRLRAQKLQKMGLIQFLDAHEPALVTQVATPAPYQSPATAVTPETAPNDGSIASFIAQAPRRGRPPKAHGDFA